MKSPSIVFQCADLKRIAAASSGIVTIDDPEAERERLQACADQHLADGLETAADERKCGLPAGALRDLADQLDDIGLFPDDSEIVSEIRAMFMTQWGMDSDQADARMSVFNYQVAVAAFTGEQA